MPELPEVETVCRGIARHATGRIIEQVIVRERRLRLPVDNNLRRRLCGQKIVQVRRRGKYLIFDCADGAVIAHLGMSGVFYFADSPPHQTHEHIGLKIGGRFLIYKDPRRFGCFVWSSGAPESHALLCALGPEPLSANFNGDTLRRALQNKSVAIKPALLDGRTVAGVGNIYASESLHLAGIRPQTVARKIGALRTERLAAAIKTILRRAIAAGGSTIKDFAQPDNTPGYFQTSWKVYAQAGTKCACGGTVRQIRQSGRTTYYCPRCQR